MYTAAAELIDTGSGRIRFFPDGGATGGAIDLALGEQHSRVSVDWLTGQVEIERASP
jgi:general secretion pathway protein H